jgi:hypothetical protein
VEAIVADDDVLVDNGAEDDYEVRVDRIGDSLYQYVKLAFGVSGDINRVSSADPLPVTGTLEIDDSTPIEVDVTNTVDVNVLSGGAAVATDITSGRVNVTTTSGSILAANTDRTSVTFVSLITNTAAVDIGPSGVASGSGFLLNPGDAITIDSTAAIHADAASGTQVLSYIEETN